MVDLPACIGMLLIILLFRSRFLFMLLDVLMLQKVPFSLVTCSLHLLTWFGNQLSMTVEVQLQITLLKEEKSVKQPGLQLIRKSEALPAQ